MSKVIAGILERTGLKAPWRVTGPVASPEWQPSQKPSTVYRKTAPANQSAQAVVPHAENDKVYDIKYAHRDVRRIKAARATETFDAVVADLVGDVSPVSANGQKDGYYGKIFSSRRKYMDSTDGGYT